MAVFGKEYSCDLCLTHLNSILINFVENQHKGYIFEILLSILNYK